MSRARRLGGQRSSRTRFVFFSAYSFDVDCELTRYQVMERDFFPKLKAAMEKQQAGQANGKAGVAKEF